MTKIILSFLLVTAQLFILGITANAVETPPIAMVINRVAVPPVIDGAVDDACWKNAQWMPLRNLKGEAVKVGGRAALAFDGEKLYAAFMLDEPQPEKINAPAVEAIEVNASEIWDGEMLEWMRKAGCDYISISPESGSPDVLKLMNKPFDYGHGIAVVKKMNELGISSQACFVLGFPGETDGDLKKTREYITRLAHAGLDEIALFIMTPLPGSEAMANGTWEYGEVEELTFSPKWRKEYGKLSKARTGLYLHFLAVKARSHPGKLARNAYNVLRRSYETKMEMTAARAFTLMRPRLWG